MVCILRALLRYNKNNLCAMATMGEKIEINGETNLYKFSNVFTAHTVLVEMSSAVRKAFSIHACDINGSCRVDENKKEILHYMNPTSTIHFRVIRRKNGYPPRRS